MTIPAGSNWCTECQETCHDHATICTVCGTTLTADTATRSSLPRRHPPSSTDTSNAFRLVPESLSQEIRSTGQELRALLQSTRAQIAQVNMEQTLLRDELVAAQQQEWQTIPAALWDPQNATAHHKPTAEHYLNAIPRVTLTPNNPIFHQSLLEWSLRRSEEQHPPTAATTTISTTSQQQIQPHQQPHQQPQSSPRFDHSMRAIPGAFGAPRDDRLVIGPSILVLADPVTGSKPQPQQASWSDPTMATIQRHRRSSSGQQQQRHVLVYLQRGGGISFVEKAVGAQRAGASACIIGNSVSEPWPFTMQDGPNQAETLGLTIPVVMVSLEDGQKLLSALRQGDNNDDDTTPIIQCSLTIQKNDAGCPDCCVCTDALAVGDVVLTLPTCRHTFHSNCATTWLTQHNTCPYCRAELPLQDTRQEQERRRNATSAATRDASLSAFYG